jgi:hypothetical protein
MPDRSSEELKFYKKDKGKAMPFRCTGERRYNSQPQHWMAVSGEQRIPGASESLDRF